MTTPATQKILDMQSVTPIPRDVDDAQRMSLVEYMRHSPSSNALDVLEKRARQKEIGVIRQVRPGVYTFVERNRLTYTDKP